MFTVNKNPTTDDLYKFAWSMLGGFGAMGLLLWLASSVLGWIEIDPDRARRITFVLFAIGAVMFTVGRFAPHAAARALYVGWMSAVVPIGIVMSTIMLTVLFIVILPIFSVIVRLGDPLRKKLNTGASYWEDSKPYEHTIERMRRPF